jgi:hypothetical protein
MSSPPDIYILANAAASNHADVLFARSGAYSPSKFVSTLPSITLSALLQVTGWVGPVLCLQGGERTVEAALAEAELLVAAGAYRRAGVFHVDLGPVAAFLQAPRRVVVRYYDVAREPENPARMRSL